MQIYIEHESYLEKLKCESLVNLCFLCEYS
jgi:hypothetical protein